MRIILSKNYSAPVLAVVILLGIGYFQPAEAVTAFAKKYSAPCTLCHSSWPRLNKVGFQFKVNGFQLPGGMDGSKAGKVSPEWNLHLDSGSANPPLGLRVRGGLVVTQPADDSYSDQEKNYLCCTETNRLSLNSAGTVKKNIGYMLNYELNPNGNGIDQGYLRFVNMFGQGYLGIDLGAFYTDDFSLVPKNRNWFGETDAAYYGNLGLRGRSQGMASGYADTGFRVYGNPNYGIFSYDLVYVTGGQAVNGRYRGRGKGTSVMGRVEGEKFGVSARFWSNKSSSLVFRKLTGSNRVVYYTSALDDGTTVEFLPLNNNPDEDTSEIILNMKYEVPKWQVEGVYVQNNFKVGSRTSGANSFSRSNITRSGISIGGIYRFSNLLTGGMRYSRSSMSSFSEVYNGTATNISASTVSRLDFQLELAPVQNARLMFGVNFDGSDIGSREKVDSNGNIVEYQQQTKFVLLWDWAI